MVFLWDIIIMGRLRSAEILLKEDGTTKMIRRAETPQDYFATLEGFWGLKKEDDEKGSFMIKLSFFT